MYLGGSVFRMVPLDLVPPRPRLRTLFTQSKAVRGTTFRTTIVQRWARWERLDDDAIRSELSHLADEQRDLLDRRARLEVEGKKLPAAGEAQLITLRADINLGRFEQKLRNYERRPWLKEPVARQVREQESAFRAVADDFALVIGEALEERLSQVRHLWPDLQTVTVDGVDLLHEDLDKAQTVAAQTALANRLELMNARAQVVDAWRQIAVKANALMGVLNVQYNLNAASPAGENEPLNVGGSRTDHQLVINGQLPLVRRTERNAYRTALIAYQRQRRVLQATEDFILNDVRTDLRQLRQLAENYKIQQRSVEVAYAQVENSLEALQAPPDPRTSAGGQTAGNAAALTQQLLNAQSSLLQAQNTLYTVWISYLIARQQFYRDLELLPLDSRGVWTDEYDPDAAAGTLPAPGGDGNLPERLPKPDPVPGGVAAPPERNSARLPVRASDGPRWQKSSP
jgi:hypothetical protein